MKKFLALVMALCMVCMTVAVASAANSSPAAPTITNAVVVGTLTNADAGLTDENATIVRIQPLGEATHLTMDMGTIPANSTLTVKCMVQNSLAAFFDKNTHTWVAASNVSLNGTTVSFTAPKGTVAVAVVTAAAGSSTGTATAGASGADVTAPKTNDVPVELILGLGVVMFAGVAVACKRRAA